MKTKKVRYVRSVVSYLDILGFRELIETRSAGEISRILRILAESVRPNPIFKAEKIQFTKFSDTVIRSIPVGANLRVHFTFELRSILGAQIALIQKGILIRGAVTIDDVVQSWGIVYGPAVVKAYGLESQPGAPPRIVVDRESLATLEPETNEGETESMLRSLIGTEGSTTYIDYLRACEDEFDVPEQEYPAFLTKHRDLVRRGLITYRNQPGILPKYEWLKTYHDHRIEALSETYGGGATRHLKI